jgi:integrase
VEYLKILQICNTMEEEALLRVTVALGLRRRDVSRIKIQNVDLVNHRITYYEHKKDRDRTLPINESLSRMLKKYINTLPKDQKYLFPWGEHVWGDITAYRRFRSLCERAGVSQRPFHALRGTCYKFLQAQGWPPVFAADLLGDTLETVQKHYATPSPAEMEELIRNTKDYAEEVEA